jgi:hypothetical protein
MAMGEVQGELVSAVISLIHKENSGNFDRIGLSVRNDVQLSQAFLRP